MDDHGSIRALIGTVDRVLAEQGVDPDVVPDDDKLLIASQYVETGGLREKMMATTPLEVQRLARVFCPAYRAP